MIGIVTPLCTYMTFGFGLRLKSLIFVVQSVHALNEDTGQMSPAEKPNHPAWKFVFFLVPTANGNAFMR
jgi:hypothetical protein